ncbi:MAG: protein kinase, partial [Planctomycetes bacterium]|nr:protein kinase [Planctomycetota bacterium]
MAEPQPDSVKRSRAVEFLEERARLLAPSEEVVNRGLRRCVRHDLRSRRVPGPVPAAPVEGKASPVAAAGDPPVAPRPPAEPITSAVASAKTLQEDEPGRVASTAGKLRSAALAVGTVLGGYRIVGLLGTGGMGQVYRASQLSMNREVAFKVLSPRFSKNARFRERFLREARAAGRLHHHNLISVHDVGEAEGLMYFSMELVEGRSVKDLINESGAITEQQAFEVAEQTLAALAYAHERGVVHRDIKPDNLMINAAGVVKVADLGLARSRNAGEDGEEEDFTTKTGTMMGTPYYMPPEQGRDAHRADHRADLYALGASLYHMICGKVPFDGETAVAILINATTQPLVFPEPGPSAVARRFIGELMAKKAAQRPQSAAAALILLRQLVAGTAPQPVPPPAVEAPVSRLRPLWPWVLIATVVLVAAMAWLWLQRVRPRWQARRDIAELVSGHRYVGALDRLELERGRAEGGWATHIDRLTEQTREDWDRWAGGLAEPAFAACDAAILARKPAEADAALALIEEAWRSPRVVAGLKSREVQIEDARSRGETAEAGRERLRRMVREAFAKAAVAGG